MKWLFILLTINNAVHNSNPNYSRIILSQTSLRLFVNNAG